MASDELASKLARRMNKCEINDEENSEIDSILSNRKASLATETNESSQLNAKLSQRLQASEGDSETSSAKREFKVFNPYTEYPEFSRKEIKNLQASFNKYDEDKDHFIGFEDLKRMMEMLGAPQTHLGLKQMIVELDEDKDGKISFREFLQLFRRARAGDLQQIAGLQDLLDKYSEMQEIEVEKVGVKVAGNFFQAKIDAQTKANLNEQEIRQEQEEKARQLEEAKARKQRFKEMRSTFQ